MEVSGKGLTDEQRQICEQIVYVPMTRASYLAQSIRGSWNSALRYVGLTPQSDLSCVSPKNISLAINSAHAPFGLPGLADPQGAPGDLNGADFIFRDQRLRVLGPRWLIDWLPLHQSGRG